jgi:hypothetical protein
MNGKGHIEDFIFMDRVIAYVKHPIEPSKN